MSPEDEREWLEKKSDKTWLCVGVAVREGGANVRTG